MPTVAEALRQHAPKLLNRLAAADTGVAIRKAFAAIMRCRTGELGGVHWGCSQCDRSHWVGRSCGNRHCPTCGHDKTRQWIDKQSTRLLHGVHHFLVTFTVPQELRSVLRVHQRAGYEALFRASADALRDVAASTKSLKDSQLGFFGVLQTWGRDPMIYHPHVHYIVPGGGAVLDSKGKPIAWKATPTNFLVHHGTLIRVYKAKLAEALRAAGLYHLIPPEVWRKKFVVDIQPEELRMIVWFALGWVYWLASGHAPQSVLHPFPKVRCTACGAEMKVIGITNDPILPTLGSHSLAYLDTG